MTNFSNMRDRLLARAGIHPTPTNTQTYDQLAKSEWSSEFEQLMRHRLIMGALRYGRIHLPNKRTYNRVPSMVRRLKKYAESGNKEFLVDVANLCLLEFVECHHPKAHFHAIDNTTEHVK